MKKYMFIIILIYCSVTTLYGQEADTVKANKFYSEAKGFYSAMKFDTAFILYEKASDIYKKRKLWNKYFYAEAEKANSKSLNYDFNTAFDIINKTIEFSENKISKESPAYAFLIFHKGKIFHNMNLPDSALSYYLKALKIREKIYSKDNRESADSYYYLNKVYFSLGDLEKAMFYNEKALKISRKLYGENNPFTINLLNDRGLIEFYSMNHRKAEKIFLKTLKLTRAINGVNSIENIYPLSYLGLVYQDLGDYDNAISNQNEVLRLSIKNLGSEHYYCGTAYQNLADSYNHKQENEIAAEYAKKALAIFANVFGEKSLDVAGVTGNLGVIYSDMQDYENAEKYLFKALELYKELKGEKSYDVSRIYQSIAAMYQEKGDYSEAEKYNKITLDIKKELTDETHYSLGQMYLNIGVNETYLKRFDRALTYLKKAEGIIIANYGLKSANTTILYNDMGETYKMSGDIKTAIKYYQKALTCNHKTFSDTTNIFSVPPAEGFYSWHDYFASILLKAEVFSMYPEVFEPISEIECYKSALNHFKVCDTILTEIKRIAVSEEDKLYLASKTTNLYKNMVLITLKIRNSVQAKSEKKKFSELSFLYSEKNKLSVLMEALAGAEAQKFAGIPDSLLQKEKNLKTDISYYKKLLAESPDSSEEIFYFDKLFKLNRSYDTLIFTFEQQYPEYYKLKYSGFKTKVSDIQKSLDKKTALISYFLTDSLLITFFISDKKFFVENSPRNKDFVKQILSFRENISNAYLLQDAYLNKDNSIVKVYTKDAAELYEQLFSDKIKNVLKHGLFSKINRLIIIPDGQLATIPFEALLTQKYSAPWTNWNNTAYFSEMPYLVKDYNISYSYSANLFYETHPKTNDRPEFQNISDWLALAPVFDNDSISGTNLRTRKLIEKNSTDQSGNIDTRAWLRNGSYISPLPGSEEETKEIFKIFEENNKKAILKTHQYANEDYVKSGALKNFKYLHFATHGMVNEEKPELSCILLAQDTTSTEDNILFSGEIYNLELNADLTVLSACETGLGKIAEGEGVIGLTRALLYAGSKNVIVSLWQVSDESTNQLMVEFYKNIFKDKNAGFAEYLSDSKRKLIREGKYAHPFFWSPFVLIGE